MEYLAAFFEGLISILPFSTQGQQPFLFMLVGIAIGFIVGILPGLGGAATLALMLPFIYNLDPTSAFAFLLGSNSVTATTGDITSVLFGVPGEGTTAATIVDGHPMAKKGEAGRALGAALMSSLVGAIFGAFALALAIPIMKPLVLSIGSAEFFMLAMLGITFVASLSGGKLARGLTAGCFGLLLATVGLDPIRSIPRFTLDALVGDEGALFLWDGISLVSVTVGLFAIPEIIDLAVQGTSIAREKPGKIGGVMQGVKDTFHHWKLVLRCSALGAYIGLIPGLGGGPAQWIAYAHAVQSSPDKERFGHGAIEGVLGPGAANNSKEGGSLIPTIAFGVPGSVSMAILLGAFTIQGIVPGPDLVDPGRYLSLTFSFVWIIVVSNIITVAVCFLFLESIAKITFVKGTFLIPFLLLLVYLGGFTVKNSFGDMALVLLFGALGWVMVELDWQRPPLLLGLVLGDIAERNLFIATRIDGAAWLLRPGVIVLTIFILGALFYPTFQAWRERRRRGDPAPGPSWATGSPKKAELSPTVWNLPAFFSLFFLIAFAYALYQAFAGFGAQEPRAALFPWIISACGAAFAVVALWKGLTSTGPSNAVSVARDIEPAVARRRGILIASWIAGFFGLIWLLGFTPTAVVGTILYLKFGAGERWRPSILLTILAWVFFYGIFDRFLHLPFSPGELLVWLGLD